MKLYVTRGIDGEMVKTLGEAKSKTQAWKKIYEFKDASKDHLKVEKLPQNNNAGRGHQEPRKAAQSLRKES